MNKYWLLPLSVLILCLTLVQPASAHVLKTDGSIGAVLHIQPDDAPTAKIPVTFVLSFQDNNKGFSLQQCDCQIAFVSENATVPTIQLAASTANTSENTVTFPAAGVYIFSVSGTPKSGAQFQPFSLEYTVRVGGGQADKRPMPLLLWVGMAMVFGLILLSAYASEYAGNNKQKGNT